MLCFDALLPYAGITQVRFKGSATELIALSAWLPRLPQCHSVVRKTILPRLGLRVKHLDRRRWPLAFCRLPPSVDPLPRAHPLAPIEVFNYNDPAQGAVMGCAVSLGDEGWGPAYVGIAPGEGTMPELPDLEVIREFLARHIVDVPITLAEVRRPLVVRNLLGVELADDLVGRSFTAVQRRGKFLLLPLDDGATLVINPMLAGRLRYGQPLGRHRKRDALVIGLADGQELRYHDAKDMGKVYLTEDLNQIPTLAGLGPEADDPTLTLQIFRERLRRHHGEIKGILTNQSFVAGIGNAYADEICWRAGLYPFRRRPSLSEEEGTRLYTAMRSVLAEAIETLRDRVGTAIDVEVRDFLYVHGKADLPCPQCGSPISKVTRQRRTTNFCRTCQPGLMVGGRDRRRP
jgi:formamidopyrimidine-DNA glycosylase